ncbi:MAG: hypothetical protein EBT15_09935 [Betaproteobacteria bacterium]|nr:hypothetical protein [Betaproteobacteria bacterium]
MPNWVSNSLFITGETASDIDEVVAQLTRPIPQKVEGKIVFEPTEFSFWNVIAPEREKWDDYFSIADGTEPRDNWYNWNINNWGAKWDANDTYIERADTNLSISFETAWSPVEPVVVRLSLQFRHLHFSYSYEEEQGWGGEVEYEAGEASERKEWDIPNSHKEYEERDRLDSCVCAWDENREDWYEDCPKGGAE